MRTFYSTVGVVVVAGAAALGCGSTATRHTVNKPPADVEEAQAAEKATTADAQAAATAKRTFHDALAMRLEKIEREIMELRTKAATISGKAQTKWDETVAALEAQAAAAKKRLAEVEAETIGTWEKLRDDASRAWEELEEAVKKAVSEADHDKPAARPAENRSDAAE